jgi:hypothetical protein
MLWNFGSVSLVGVWISCQILLEDLVKSGYDHPWSWWGSGDYTKIINGTFSDQLADTNKKFACTQKKWSRTMWGRLEVKVATKYAVLLPS